MKARNIFIWGLTPIILLLGLYLETKDIPEEPLRAHPTMILTPDLDILPSPAAIPIPPAPATPVEPLMLDFWSTWDHWDDQFDTLTKLKYKMFIEEQGELKVRLVGKVADVDTGNTLRGDCIVVVRKEGKSRHYNNTEAFRAPCSKVEHFNEGDLIEAVCTIDGINFLNNPNIKECVLQ